MQSRVLFNLFHRISDSIWNFWKFYQAQRQTPACILTIKFFQRNQLLVFFQKIIAAASQQFLPFISDLYRMIFYKGIFQFRLVQQSGNQNFRQSLIAHVVGFIPLIAQFPFQLVSF